MNFDQWQIEIVNNLEMISSYALDKTVYPEKFNQTDINRLKEYLNSLQMMYDNLKEIIQ